MWKNLCRTSVLGLETDHPAWAPLICAAISRVGKLDDPFGQELFENGLKHEAYDKKKHEISYLIHHVWDLAAKDVKEGLRV